MTGAVGRLLAADPAPLAGKSVFVGFDAFVDVVARPLRVDAGGEGRRPYASMRDFGGFVASRGGRSGSVELEERLEKLGGNAPILALALATLGASVEAVAPFGLPGPHPCFAPLARAATLHSVGEPGLTLALEFEDGKLMLGLNREVDRLDYRTLTDALPADRLREIACTCDALAVVNWSEMRGSTDLLDGLARDVLPRLPRPVPMLVDLSDCTRRDPADLADYLRRLAALPPTVRVVLGLNRTEADRVRVVLGLDAALADEQAGARIRDTLGLAWVAIHGRDRATLVWDDGALTLSTPPCERPRLLTGAGDNFNAGLLAGWLAGLAPPDALALAADTARFYVANARSAAWTDLREAPGPIRGGTP